MKSLIAPRRAGLVLTLNRRSGKQLEYHEGSSLYSVSGFGEAYICTAQAVSVGEVTEPLAIFIKRLLS